MIADTVVNTRTLRATSRVEQLEWLAQVATVQLSWNVKRDDAHGRIQGGPGAQAPYFWKSQFYFLHCIQCLKTIFEIEFWFYSGWNPRSFWKCGGVCGRVCVSVWSHRPTRQISRFFYLISVGFEIVAATVFLFCKGPILNDIRSHSDPKNIWQIAGNRV